jgi:YesN/AraC family two-component response regulator
MLTGYPTVETARRSLTLGAHEYLVKPIDIDELEQKVKKVLTTQKKKSKKPIHLG